MGVEGGGRSGVASRKEESSAKVRVGSWSHTSCQEEIVAGRRSEKVGEIFMEISPWP